MAAEYGININVRTQTQQLKNLQLQLKAVDNLAKSIKAQQIAPELKGGSPELLRKFKDRIAQIRNEVIVANNAFVNNTKQINNNAGEIRGFSQALRDARANVKLFSGEYNVLTQGIQKADFTARFKELKEFSRIAADQAANLGGAIPMARGTTFEDLMSFRPTNTREAINSYISMLRGLEARLDRTSNRFKQVTARIKEMETQLRSPIIQDTANAYSRPAGPRQAMAGENFFNRTLGRNRQFQQGGMFFEPGGFASRRRNALSSGLIGGGFPLLFGQGLGASVGGGIGGIAGGFLGGGLGFGLSIVGTQLGKTVDVLVQATTKTGQALGDLTKDANVLVEALGNTNNAFGQRIQLLEQAEGKQAAFEEAVKQTASVVGEQGVTALKLFGDETRELQTGLAQIFLQFQAGLARVNKFLGITKILADMLPRNFSGELMNILSNPNVGNEFNQMKGPITGKTVVDIMEELRRIENPKNLQELLMSQATKNSFFHRKLKDDAERLIEVGNNIINNEIAQEFFNRELKHQIELNETVGYQARQQLRIEKKINDEIKRREEIMGRRLQPNEIEKVRELVEATEGLALGMRLVNDEIEKLDIEMIKLNDTGHQIVELSKSISESFSESFKGIIKGTMSVQEAFRNMFMRIADHFLDMAAQMMAAQISRGFLGLFGNIFTSGGNNLLSNSGLTAATPGEVTIADFNRANGGPVMGGSSYIVGERGPEIFSPGVSGTITPNHALGGSTSVVVNVDASGTSVQGDQQNAEQLGRLIGAVVQSELIKEKRPGGLLA